MATLYVTQASANPSVGAEGIGETISITLTFSEPVTVSGAAPILQLNDGGAAAYASGSGTNTLTFSYTVGASDTSESALAITGVANSASVTDGTGNAADFSAALTLLSGPQIDTVPPTVTITSAGGLTNQSTQTIAGAVTTAQGEAAIGSTVTLYDNGAQIGTAQVTNGQWTANVTLPTQGANAITAMDTDAAGNTGTSEAVTYTLATATNIVQDGAFLNPIGTGSNLTPWSDWTDAGITRSAAPAGIPGDYASLPVGADLFERFSALAPGVYTLSFLVENQSPWAANLVLAVQQALGTDVNTLFNAGTAEELNLPASMTNFVRETLNFTITQNEGFIPNELTFSNSYDAPVGPIADSVNPAGTIIDIADVSLTNAPTVAITSAGGVTNQASQTIAGTVTAGGAAIGSTVTLYDNGVQIGTAQVTSGQWSTTVTLPTQGANAITASDTDAAGNTGASAAVTYTLESVAPTAAVSLNSGDVNLASNTATVTFAFSEAPVDFSLANTSAVGGTLSNLTSSNGGLTYTATYTANAGADIANAVVSVDGNWTDAAGNPGAPSSSAPFLVDTIAPSVAISSTGGAVDQALQTISGTGEAGTTINIYDNNGATPLATTTVGSNGAWTATNITLSSGVNSITATDTDAAGNTGASSAVNYTLSSPPGLSISETVTGVFEPDGTPEPDGNVHQAGDYITYAINVTNTGTTTFTNVSVNDALSASSAGSNGNLESGVTLAPGASIALTERYTVTSADIGNGGTFDNNYTPGTDYEALVLDSTLSAITPLGIDVNGNLTNNESSIYKYIAVSANAVNTIVAQKFTVSSASQTAAAEDASNQTFIHLSDAQVQALMNYVDFTSPTSSTVGLLNNFGNIYDVVTVNSHQGSAAASTDVPLNQTPTAESAISDVAVTIGSDGTSYIINAATTLTGTAPSGDTVVVTDGQGNTYAAAVAANGSWTAVISGLANGHTYSYTATATDAAGNSQSSPAFSFTVDTVQPNVSISGTGGTVIAASQPISGTVSAAAGEPAVGGTVTILDNGAEIGTATVTNGQWSTTVSLPNQGANAITVTDTDAAGNTGTAAVTYTLESVAPTVAITSTGGVTNQAGQTIAGTVTAAQGEAAIGTTVTLYDNGAEIGTATVTNGQWSTTVSLPNQGANAITASDTDAAGNTGASAAVTYTLESVAPTVAITSAGGVTNHASQTISGTVTAAQGEAAIGSTVTLYDNGVQIGMVTVTNGQWTANVTLPTQGTNAITATDTDAAGNTGTSAAVSYTLQSVPPTVAITSSGGLTNKASQTISGTVSTTEAAAGGTVAILDNGTQIGTATLSGGSWSTQVTLSGDGSHSITAADTDAAGNTGTSAAVSYTLDTAPPTVAISSTGGLTNKASQTISGTVSTTEAAAGGTVAILDNGVQIGTATLSGGSWSTQVTLSNQGANAITATDTDAAGNIGTSASVTYTLNAVPPTITQTVANPATGDEGLGRTVTITLTFSEEVTVTGASPSLQLSDGGVATYASGSGSDQLTFTYTVSAGNTNTSALAVTGVTNGSSVTDAAGDTANFGGADVTFTGLQVDSTVPAMTAVAAQPSSGAELVGSTVTITVTLSEAVTVTGGTPTLSLNDGGVATYVKGSGNTLTFTYTVGSGNTSVSALAVTGLNLNSATIADAAGNAASLSNVSATFTGLQINTAIPVITAVSASPATGDLDAGKTVTITLDFDKAVTVKGKPTLTMTDGATATYTSGSGTSALTFTYTVAAGQNTTDLAVTAVTIPTGASIKDASGDTASLALPSTANLGLQIDTTAPTVAAVSSPQTGEDLNAGKTVAISLTLSEPVVVTGTPTLTLSDGGTASYVNGSGTNTLTFDYTVASGQNAANLSVTKLNTTGASIQDLAGNAVKTALPASAALGIQIDTKAPTVTAESASAPSNDLNAGKTAVITLTMSEAVDVTGTPTLTLNDGGTAAYASGSGTSTLTFDYTVAPGQNTTALKITGFGPAGSITDLAGNALAAMPSTSLSLQVDTVTPAVSSVSSSHALGTATGDEIAITLKMNEAVAVSGTPELLLNNGGAAAYNPAASTSTSLVFDYIIAANQGAGSANLSIVGAELASPSAIQDGAGNVGGLTLTAAEAALNFKITSTPAGSPAPVTISGASEAELYGASSQTVTFASGADGTLKLDAASAYAGAISGLTQTDTLDLASLAYVNGAVTATTAYNSVTNTTALKVGDGASSVTLTLDGNYSTSTWTLSNDGSGGTDVVDPPASSGSSGSGSPAGAAHTVAASGLDLTGAALGANATLGFQPGSYNGGGLPAASQNGCAGLALLAQHMASNFALPGGDHGGGVAQQPAFAAPPLVANPHHA
jgi:hypothetical protein